MDTYGGSGLTSKTLRSAFSDLSPNQKQSQPAAFQRINTESCSLLCHFNKPEESKLEAIVCFRRTVSCNFVTTLVLDSFFFLCIRTTLMKHQGGTRQSFSQTVLGSLIVITTDTYATIKAGRISMSSIITRSGSSFMQTYSEKPLLCRLFSTLVTFRTRTAAQ